MPKLRRDKSKIMNIKSVSFNIKLPQLQKPFHFDIYVPNHSRGLYIDALILQGVLGEDRSRIIEYPFDICAQAIEYNNYNVSLAPLANTAIFIERIFEHNSLLFYKNRILIPNLEWLDPKSFKLANGLITEFWHKTNHGFIVGKKLFPNTIHVYTGFTSLAKNYGDIVNYDKFCHFSGKSGTRHTQDLINIWLSKPSFPEFAIQSYGVGLSIPIWMKAGNIKAMFGYMSESDYISEITNYGVHICTSQMEGFGHYINEARSIGALILTLDAPPMNELIDSSCGVLVQHSKSEPFNKGTRFFADPDLIEQAIIKVIDMPLAVRKSLGENAKIRYIKERAEFLMNIKNASDRLAG